MIKHLTFKRKDSFYEDYEFEANDSRTLNISKINLLIGANNSGKSRFLRQLFIHLSNNYCLTNNRVPFFSSSDFDNADVHIVCVSTSEITERLAPIVSIVNSYVVKDYKFDIAPLLNKDSGLYHEGDLLRLVESAEALLKGVARSEFYSFEEEIKRKSGQNYDRYLRFWRSGTDLLDALKGFISIIYSNPNYSFTFLPAFRTLRRFQKRRNDLDKEKQMHQHFYPYATSNFERLEDLVVRDKLLFDYFINYSEKKDSWLGNQVTYQVAVKEDFIFTGEGLYDRIYRLRNSVAETRQLLLDFERFISDTFFSGVPVTINSLKKDDIEDVFIKIGEGPEFPIQFLGDGIQALIILVFPLFEKKSQNHFVFIEEPEIYLHPAYQRAFMQMLRQFPRTQLFVATHSNHILELSQEFPHEIRMNKFAKNHVGGKDVFNVIQFPSISIDLLNSLGVRNSSVFLSNCTIWVEGISDRLYIKKYLDIFLNENPTSNRSLVKYKEDIHFSFVEYSGNNIQHWGFVHDEGDDRINATKIANRIFLIHDNDPNKKGRYDRLTKELGDHFYKLECREIENLLSPEILVSTIKSYQKAENNTSTISAFEYSDYCERDIGEFLYDITNNDQYFS